MHATSVDVGTCPVDQSAAVCQLPSPGPVQVSVQTDCADGPAAIVRQASRAVAATPAIFAPTEPFRKRLCELLPCPSPRAGPCEDIPPNLLVRTPLGAH